MTKTIQNLGIIAAISMVAVTMLFMPTAMALESQLDEKGKLSGAWKPCKKEKKAENCVTGKPESCLVKGEKNGKMWYQDLNKNNIQDGKERAICSSKNPNAGSGGISLPPK